MRKREETKQWIDELDRGTAKYFHGRKEVLRKFQKRLEHATARNSGTIFLIQAPLGAGKTALVEECKKTGRQGQVADPEDLGDCLVEFKRVVEASGKKTGRRNYGRGTKSRS